MSYGQQMQASAYWQMVRETETEIQPQPQRNIDGCPVWFITSIANKLKGIVGGSIADCSCRNAAQRITEGSHRMSTEEEVQKYYADQARRADDCRLQEDKRKTQGAVLKVSREDLRKLGEV